MPSQIIGEKRKNQEISNLENENKKIKQEFVVFEEKEEPQEIKKIRIEIDESNYQVIYKHEVFSINHFLFFVNREFEKI